MEIDINYKPPHKYSCKDCRMVKSETIGLGYHYSYTCVLTDKGVGNCEGSSEQKRAKSIMLKFCPFK